jgi:hypothetical protein
MTDQTNDTATDTLFAPGANLPPAKGDFTPTHQSPAISSDSLTALADDLIRLGVPEDRVRQAGRASGVTVTPDNRTPEEAQWENTFGAPSSPDAYKLNYFGRSAGVSDTDLAAFNGEMQSYLHSLGLSVELGNYIGEQLLTTGQALGKMSAAERAEWDVQQQSILERVAGGPEAAAELRKLAGELLAKGKAGEIANAVAAYGATNDAVVIVQLGRHAQRLAARPGR